MKDFIFSAVIASCIASQLQAMPKSTCASSLSPIEMVAPKLPSQPGSQYEGLITAVVTVEKSGFISHSEIESVNVTQLDRRNFVDSGYSEAILDAIGKWKFPVVPNRCKKEIKINLSLSKY